MAEKSKRDLIWEEKKRKRDETLKREREGDAPKAFQSNEPRGIREDTFGPPASNQTPFGHVQNEPVRVSGGGFNREERPSEQNQGVVGGPSALVGQGRRKQLIQAQKVNQQLTVQTPSMSDFQAESNGSPPFQQPQGSHDTNTTADNFQQQQQQQQQQNYNLQLQQQQQADRARQDRDRDRIQRDNEQRRLEDEKRKQNDQKTIEDERQRKEAYRISLQEQMKAKENKPSNDQTSGRAAYTNVRNSNEFLPPSAGGGGGGIVQKNSKQELAEYLRFQMAQKNQVQGIDPANDKKQKLQQQMEVIQQQQQPIAGPTSYARRNINNMYNNTASAPQQQQQQQYQQQQQQQPQSYQQTYNEPPMHLNNNNQQPGGVGFGQGMYPNQMMQQAQAPQSAQRIGSIPRNSNNRMSSQDIQSSSSHTDSSGGFISPPSSDVGGGQANFMRGNKNFMKVENADVDEVGRRQQQQLDYQKVLQKQIEEKARTKKEEAEKLKREELQEEQRVQREQEAMRKQVEGETNVKKQKLGDVQKENENLLNDKRKKKERKQFDAPSSSQITASHYSDASREFLNEEKKSEGIDPQASIIDFYRKKSAQNLHGSQAPMTPQPMQMMQPNMMNAQMQPQSGMMMPGMQNPMGFGNPYMMGQQGGVAAGMGGAGGGGMMNPMMMMQMQMMNPLVLQQQQMLAKQQAELLPQLYELRLQMQQQQMQMQQQIDVIKSQANIAIEERNRAEAKFNELKNQYEIKQKEEKKYADQLNEALQRNHPTNPTNPAHLKIARELGLKETPKIDQDQNYPWRPAVSEIPFGGSEMKQEAKKVQAPQPEERRQPLRARDQLDIPEPDGRENNNRNDQGARQKNHVEDERILIRDESNDSMPIQLQIPAGQQRNSKEEEYAREAREEYSRKMEMYGMKSLVSDNKFIPLDILDNMQRQDQQISMSKLAGFGVNGSQFPTIDENRFEGIPRRPPSQQKPQGKWDIPSINSDITKEIDQLMNNVQGGRVAQGQQGGAGMNGNNNFATQDSFYEMSMRNPQGFLKAENENQRGNFSAKPPSPGMRQQGMKPPTRGGSGQSMRGNAVSKPFGAAARGVLGDSRAFEQQQQQQQQKQQQLKQQQQTQSQQGFGTFKTNSDQVGYNVGSDFPDFSMNVQPQQHGLKFGESAVSLKKDGNMNNNVNTYNTNNFDIDKIMLRNEERLNKLNEFGIPTINDQRPVSGVKRNQPVEDETLDKLDELLLRFNMNNNIS